MSSKIKFVYFDVGNVLVKFEGGFQAISEKHNLPLSDISASAERYDVEICRGDMSRQEWYERLTKDLGVEYDHDLDFTSFWISHFKPILETDKLVNDIVKDDLKVGILSNLAFRTWDRLILMELVPNISYDAMVRSSDLDIKIVKPERKIYEIAQERSGVRSTEILFTDDRQENLDTAKKLGWKTVLFDKNNPNKSILEIKKILGMN